MDAVTYISVGIFLLVPYYLRIFLLNHNKTKGHIAFWIAVHLLACVFYYVKLGEIFSIPFIVLIGCGGYYLVSYFFEVRWLFLIYRCGYIYGNIREHLVNKKEGGLRSKCYEITINAYNIFQWAIKEEAKWIL